MRTRAFHVKQRRYSWLFHHHYATTIVARSFGMSESNVHPCSIHSDADIVLSSNDRQYSVSRTPHHSQAHVGFFFKQMLQIPRVSSENRDDPIPLVRTEGWSPSSWIAYTRATVAQCLLSRMRRLGSSRMSPKNTAFQVRGKRYELRALRIQPCDPIPSDCMHWHVIGNSGMTQGFGLAAERAVRRNIWPEINIRRSTANTQNLADNGALKLLRFR